MTPDRPAVERTRRLTSAAPAGAHGGLAAAPPSCDGRSHAEPGRQASKQTLVTHPLEPLRTPAQGDLDRLRRRLDTAGLIGVGLVGTGLLVHRLLAPLPAGLVKWGTPAAVAALVLGGVAEVLGWASWGTPRTTVVRWTRPAVGVALSLGVLARMINERGAAPAVDVFVAAAAGVVGAALLLDGWQAARQRKLPLRYLGGMVAGALGLLFLAVLLGASRAIPDVVWGRLFLANLALLVAGGYTYFLLKRAGTVDRGPDADA